MAKARKGDTVSVYYTGRLQNGMIVDKTDEGFPVKFTIGKGTVMPGMEEAVIGMKLKQSKTVEVPAEKAFGPYQKELLLAIDKKQLPDNMDIEVGQSLDMKSPDNRDVKVRVVSQSDREIVVDANHPLAGQDLTIDIRLVNIQINRKN